MDECFDNVVNEFVTVIEDGDFNQRDIFENGSM